MWRLSTVVLLSQVAFLWYAALLNCDRLLYPPRHLRILDTVHLIMVTHTVYHYAITNFGDFLGVLKPTW